MAKTASSVASPQGFGWREALANLRIEPSHQRIFGGSVVMLVGSTLVSIVNFAYNVAVAHMLGPAAFGHAVAAVTLLMLVSAITLSFQLVCAKFVAKNDSPGGKAAVYSVLLRRAWLVGVLLGSILILAAGVVAAYLNLPSTWIVDLLAFGIAFYIPLGVKRGGMQGVCQFSRLTWNFILEAVVKFLGAVMLVQMGLGVSGAVAAISASVVLAYFIPPVSGELEAEPDSCLPASFHEGMQAIVFFVGQVIINNIDILLVKHFFQPATAGIYAAIALVGRVLYFASWSVVSAMFPISAGAKVKQDDPSVVVVPLLLVLGIAIVFVMGLGFFPDLVLHTMFGAGFQSTGRGLDSLLSLYAAATGAYSLSVVLMAYEMSRRIANTGWLQLVFSGAIVVGIYFFHTTLREVVVVQVVLMLFLLIAVSVPFFRLDGTPQVQKSALLKLRRTTEAEVISEFLKSEFYHEEFHPYRERFADLVMNADTASPGENALRRALLFRRRGHMWRELPTDTAWFEIRLQRDDLGLLRVFPRAQWRRIASRSFLLTEVVERVRERQRSGKVDDFIAKVQSLSYNLRLEPDNSSVILIGLGDGQPLTIIEGNHRLTAALLASPEVLQERFRVFCGVSPRMNRCCWYKTSIPNLWRYARNRLENLWYDREADIARLAPHDSMAEVETCADAASRKVA